MCRKGIVIIMLMQLLLIGAFTYKEEAVQVVATEQEKTLGIVASVSSKQRVIDYGTLTREVLPYNMTAEEYEMLLRIVEAEAGGEDTEGKILVANVVLNRVESSRFSSTVRGVLYARDQFTPVMDGSFDEAVPNDACRNALDMVIHGWDESEGALFYEFCEGESWHSKNLKLLTEHCNTRFYE